MSSSETTAVHKLPAAYAAISAAAALAHSDRVAWAFALVLPHESRQVARQSPLLSMEDAAVRAAVEVAKMLPSKVPSALLLPFNLEPFAKKIEAAVMHLPLCSVAPLSQYEIVASQFAAAVVRHAEAEADRAGAF